jgi:hypothetical protein
MSGPARSPSGVDVNANQRGQAICVAVFAPVVFAVLWGLLPIAWVPPVAIVLWALGTMFDLIPSGPSHTIVEPRTPSQP